MEERNCTYTCDENALCCKIQSASIQSGLNAIKNNPDSREIILEVLDAITESLFNYNCKPRSSLRTRIFWVLNQIRPHGGTLTLGERAKLDMIVAELEAFIGNH